MHKAGQVFSYRGISFSGAVSKKYDASIYDYVIGEILWSASLNKFLNAARPSIVLANGNRLDDTTLAELCNAKNIPSIMISHGSHVPPKNTYENMEWGELGRTFLRAPFSAAALQTPLSEGYLKAFPSAIRV